MRKCNNSCLITKNFNNDVCKKTGLTSKHIINIIDNIYSVIDSMDTLLKNTVNMNFSEMFSSTVVSTICHDIITKTLSNKFPNEFKENLHNQFPDLLNVDKNKENIEVKVVNGYKRCPKSHCKQEGNYLIIKIIPIKKDKNTTYAVWEVVFGHFIEDDFKFSVGKSFKTIETAYLNVSKMKQKGYTLYFDKEFCPYKHRII